MPVKGTLDHLAAVYQLHVRSPVIPYRQKFQSHCGCFESRGHSVVGVVVEFDHAVCIQISEEWSNTDYLISPPGEFDPLNRQVIGGDEHCPGKQFRTDRIGLE